MASILQAPLRATDITYIYSDKSGELWFPTFLPPQLTEYLVLLIPLLCFVLRGTVPHDYSLFFFLFFFFG